jgi:hypothetical protein
MNFFASFMIPFILEEENISVTIVLLDTTHIA